MQIFRYAEAGSIQFLWVIATNPAVSLPDLPRIRKILGKEDLFLVVQDAFLTETTEFADVVLPAAIWGEKTGHASPTPTAPSTSPTRPSSRPARRGPTSTSSSTSPAGWTSATRTAPR